VVNRIGAVAAMVIFILIEMIAAINSANNPPLTKNLL
jgi:hypothetical protein